MIFELAQRRVFLNAFRNGALVSFLLAAVFSGNLASTTVAADPIYTVLEVPVALPAAGSINNKSQVATTRVVGTGVMLDIWLPAADYGLAAGVHSYSVPFNLPGLISPSTSIAVKRFADNGTVYLSNGSYANLTFHDGVFAALIGFVAGRSDLFRAINMSANGIIYAKPWDPLTGSPGRDGKSRYLKTGPGHPREEYLAPPNSSSEFFSLGYGNSHGVQIMHGALIESGNMTLTMGTWNGAFTQLTVPGSGGYFIDINDKGQLVSPNGYFYLPAGDYGRGGGFHAFSFTPGPNNAQVSAISGHGEIYGFSAGAPGNEIFSIEHDKVINLNQALAPGTAATITHILWINDNGVILATGSLNGQPNKLFILNPGGELSITAPAADEIVPPDAPYTIRFKAPANVMTVDLYLVTNSLSSGGARTLLAENVTAAGGSFVWQVPESLSSPSTFIIAVDAEDPTLEAVGARFRVRTPWWLYRVTGTFQEPKYEYVHEVKHAFSFLPQGDETVMWPLDYWDGPTLKYDDTEVGYDPFAGDGFQEVRYHPGYFRKRFSSEYPPWKAAVFAFGIPGTYVTKEPWTLGGVVWNQPNPEAALWWNWELILDGDYGGACYGLSMAMMAAFQDPTRFDQKWLLHGGSENLASLDASNDVLDTVHALYVYQFGRLQQAERAIGQAMTPRDVVSRLKAMFERDDRDRDRILFIEGEVDKKYPNGKYMTGAHAVVPISMTRQDGGNTEEGLYAVAVFDPNFGPMRGDGKDNPRFIFINSAENWWSHADGFWRGDYDTGIYLSMEVINVFEKASSTWPHVYNGSALTAKPAAKTVGGTAEGAESETFSVGIIGRGGAVTSGAGELRYEEGVRIETLPGGFISFPITGAPSEPDAYVVPSGAAYRAEAVPRADGIAGVRISGGAVTASILQTDAASPTRAVVDLLEDGLSVVSGGPGMFELTGLVLANGAEFRSMRASGLVATNPASLGLTADAGGFRLAGADKASSYHLELGSSTGNGSRVFDHADVLLEARATHMIQPHWATLGEGPVTIDVDRDGDGQTDETLVVTNQAPSTSIPVNPNLLAQNSGFESQPVDTSLSLPPVVTDGATFTGWRVFNVTTNSVAFSATIIANASAGSRAMRLAVTNTGGTANHALDQWSPEMHTPVQLGQRYVVSFDAAWIAGLTASNLLFQVQEFDSAGSFLGNGLSTLRSVSTTGYQKHTFIYQPVNPATAGIGLFFGPLRGVVGATTISLDNVRMVIAPLLVNGDFEFSPLTTSAGGTGVFVNTTTFLGWRLFSVGSPPITSLTGTIVDAGGYTGGQPGNRAMRLAVTNTGSPTAHDYGLDNSNARSPVVTGKKYTLSFDVALVQVGGSLRLNVSVAEFNAAGTFTGTQGGFAPALTADQTFHRYTMTYVVTNPAATQVVIAFRPVTTGQSTLVLDNVVFVADTPPSLSFSVNELTLGLTWPASHLGWRAQSNSVNVANPNSWFDIPGSESVTNLNLPVSPAMPAVFYRLRRP